MHPRGVSTQNINARRVKKYVVMKSFKEFLPDPKDFTIVEETITALKPNEFVIKAEYISVDPYMRAFAESQEVPYDQFGFQLGKVVESRNPAFPIDAFVVAHAGWRNFAALSGVADEVLAVVPYIPVLGELPPSLAMGALGMPGVTAYLGFLEICKPMKKEVVCVTSAAGAVGSIVGQIARIKGCTVVGICGSDEKVKVLTSTFRFHHGINYKTEPHLTSKLKSLVPNGIDCFFDSVGGVVSQGVLACMREGGRVARCGAISGYGRRESGVSTSSLRRAELHDSVNVESFSFTQWDREQQQQAMAQLAHWILAGEIKVKEKIIKGFEELPNTLIGLLKGDFIGKAVVEV